MKTLHTMLLTCILALIGTATPGTANPFADIIGNEIGSQVADGLLNNILAAKTKPVTKEDMTACNKGKAAACYRIGYSLVSSKPSKAIYYFKRACKKGYMKGCSAEGTLYVKGRGVRRNYAKARTLFTKACNHGDASGCHNLGLIYVNGHGVRKNRKIARKYFQKACKRGMTQGCKNVKLIDAGY